MNLIWFLIIGLLAGGIAGKITEGHGFGFIGNIIVGIIGAVIGGFLLGLIGIKSDGLIGQLVISVIGAIVLLLIVQFFSPKGKKA
jgi:uncharacterized membrane protein YeaQ/YmgE (transglycosylase-associated protein family)